MIARMTLKRGLVALWCLAVAAGCAKVTEEAVTDAATVAEPATVPAPAVVGSQASVVTDAATLDPARSASLDSLADGGKESIDEPLTTAEAPPPPPSVPTADLPLAALEPPDTAAPLAARREPEAGSDHIAPSVASSPTADALNVASLLTRLRKTKGINLRTKLAVKKESDDLMERFRAYHARHGTATLGELRRSYDALFLKLYALLEDADPPLARDVDRSRGAIWAILADPLKFGASAPNLSTRGLPPA